MITLHFHLQCNNIMLQYTNGVVPENIHTHPKYGHWVSKAKLFKGKYEAKLEIPAGGGERGNGKI